MVTLALSSFVYIHSILWCLLLLAVHEGFVHFQCKMAVCQHTSTQVHLCHIEDTTLVVSALRRKITVKKLFSSLLFNSYNF
jgi:hypothetical protein